ncbi:hypothetical protein CEUSTIGMA_g5996.t1 [Chlamydomonas eustigma]|uniref:Uncharacterized protein n=1 Tax=Chlamydomonas eustigma TaxID=1157962 RepID=A0A250X685_9CHLO|nr:hypothetical protein CEUSTIGMA_g5996.t1 [Chlamydomonas eustigma]|eukprot:GAX78556.1 hypothetical protein CEUSTIGMA_g5996.t1 [Chlamydomonas eustigma]
MTVCKILSTVVTAVLNVLRLKWQDLHPDSVPVLSVDLTPSLAAVPVLSVDLTPSPAAVPVLSVDLTPSPAAVPVLSVDLRQFPAAVPMTQTVDLSLFPAAINLHFLGLNLSVGNAALLALTYRATTQQTVRSHQEDHGSLLPCSLLDFPHVTLQNQLETSFSIPAHPEASSTHIASDFGESLSPNKTFQEGQVSSYVDSLLRNLKSLETSSPHSSSDHGDPLSPNKMFQKGPVSSYVDNIFRSLRHQPASCLQETMSKLGHSFDELCLLAHDIVESYELHLRVLQMRRNLDMHLDTCRWIWSEKYLQHQADLESDILARKLAEVS